MWVKKSIMYGKPKVISIGVMSDHGWSTNFTYLGSECRGKRPGLGHRVKTVSSHLLD